MLCHTNVDESAAGSITAPTATAYTMVDHIISCAIRDVSSKVTNVQWSPITSTAGAYSADLGSWSSSAKTQTATLTIKNTELAMLRAASSTHTFTCKVTIGNKIHTSTQKLTVLTPSKLLKDFLLYFYSSVSIISQPLLC